MFNVMICKQEERKQERCWLCQERCLVMPRPEKQITCETGDARMAV